jgi:hypothetical protein
MAAGEAFNVEFSTAFESKTALVKDGKIENNARKNRANKRATRKARN